MSNRGTILLTEAEILSQTAHAGDQHILRLQAPEAAQKATPGSFAHLSCDPSVPMRRPLSIMRADPESGWLEFLYKPVGQGLRKLAGRKAGERLSMLAPIGNGFRLEASRPRVLALGGGVGIPPMLFLAETLARSSTFEPVVLMGSEVPFPFELVAATGSPAEWPDDARSSLALLEQWGVPSRLASRAGLDGAHAGFVTGLARFRLGRDDAATLARTQIVACGPEPMLAAAARLARDFDLPCQLAVEEFMACGVGGCAGCTILLQTAAGPAMKRVCVDGPVFDAREVYPD